MFLSILLSVILRCNGITALAGGGESKIDLDGDKNHDVEVHYNHKNDVVMLTNRLFR